MKQQQQNKGDPRVLHNNETASDPHWFSVGKNLLQDYTLPPKAPLVPQNSTLHNIQAATTVSVVRRVSRKYAPE